MTSLYEIGTVVDPCQLENLDSLIYISSGCCCREWVEDCRQGLFRQTPCKKFEAGYPRPRWQTPILGNICRNQHLPPL